jgi:hypothetical protein
MSLNHKYRQPCIYHGTRQWRSSSAPRRTLICAGTSEQGDSNPTPPLAAALAAPAWWNVVPRVITAALGGTVLLAAVAPALISTRLGTAAAAAAASRVLPGDVRIERVQLGWARPLLLEGLELHEGAAGASRRLLSLRRATTAGEQRQAGAPIGSAAMITMCPCMRCDCVYARMPITVHTHTVSLELHMQTQETQLQGLKKIIIYFIQILPVSRRAQHHQANELWCS